MLDCFPQHPGRARLALAVLFAAALGAAPAYALCTVCSASVRLDSSLAACFSQKLDSELAALQTSGEGFVIVDLSDCPSRGGLPTGIANTTLPLDTRFVADAQSLECLQQLIAGIDDRALSPSHLFDLGKECPPS